jgi:predicted regulator of Ras-like GTPase activity (Roadblock/LC7/MglB family)
MDFRETLEQICKQVDGALAASVMGYDGIAVESVEMERPGNAEAEFNVQSAMVEYSSVFGQIRAAAEQVQAGEASEFSIRTEKLVAVGRALTPDHFVVIALAPEGNLGKARYTLRIRAGSIAAEL